MAFISIDIVHKLAVRNGFVEIPDDFVHRVSIPVTLALSLIPGSVRKHQVGVAKRIIDQEWIELPAFDKADGPAQDWYQILRNNV
jgi:hypothetical protein